MKKLTRSLVALAIMLAGGLSTVSAHAGMMYEVTSHKQNGHSFWMPGIGLRHLHFDPAGMLTINSDGTAKLSGKISQGSTSFDVDADMSGFTKADQALCDAAKYENGAKKKKCKKHWYIFTGHLTGTLSIGGQPVYSIWSDGKPPPQFGTHKANAKNNRLGFSSWFYFKETGCDGCQTYHGDINVNLAVVPEPGTLALIALGIVGLVSMRKWRHQAS
ncbi:MAG: PEP-CTERM sorting domain-containing protein [Pseudomonadota bacterium]